MHTAAFVTVGGIDRDHVGVADALSHECPPILFDALAYGWHSSARLRSNLDAPDA